MIFEPHMGNHSDFIQYIYPIRYNSNVLKMKTKVGIYNGKLTLDSKFKTSLAQLGGQRFLICLDICFFQPLALSPIFQT